MALDRIPGFWRGHPEEKKVASGLSVPAGSCETNQRVHPGGDRPTPGSFCTMRPLLRPRPQLLRMSHNCRDSERLKLWQL